MKSDYTMPIAYTAKGDLKKKWHVSYYYKHPLTGLKKRVLVRGNVNRFKTTSERTKAIHALLDSLVLKLQSGYSPFSDTIVVANGQITIEHCLITVINTKKSYQKKNSFVGTKNKLNRFISWLKILRINHHHPAQIQKSHIFEFLSYLTNVRKISNRTRNNFLVELTTAFNMMQEINSSWIGINPCLGIKRLPQRSEKNEAYSVQNFERIKAWLEENDVLLYKFCRCIIYLGLRPNEIVQIKLSHIDFENWILTSPAAIQKNASVAKKRIFDIHKPDFEGLKHLPPSNYLFNCHSMGGSVPTTRDYFTRRFKILKTELRFDKNQTMYALRHTFAIQLLKSGVDLRDIMKVTGHKTLSALQHYLQTYLDEPGEDLTPKIPHIF
jgi:integrase